MGYDVEPARQALLRVCADSLAVLTTQAPEQSVRHLPIFFPHLVDHLSASLRFMNLRHPDAGTQGLLQMQADLLRAFNAIFAAMPLMMVPYVEWLVACATHRHLLESPLPDTVEQAQRLIVQITGMELSHVLSPMLTVLCATDRESHNHLVLLKALRKVLRTHEGKPLLTFSATLLGPVLTQILAYCGTVVSPTPAPLEISEALAESLFAAVRLVREGDFRALFERLVAWFWDDARATDAHLRLFYTLCTTLAAELQEVFDKYFVALLDRTQRILTEGKRHPSVIPAILRFVLRFLESHNDIKLPASQWTVLVTALTAQLPHQAPLHAVYAGTVGLTALEGCLHRICHLTRGLENQAVWTLVQKQVVFHCMDDAPPVRMDALRIVRGLYEKFEHDFAIACMPEFLPRLFELLEHDDEDLQQLAADTKLLIQRVTNENLDAYLA